MESLRTLHNVLVSILNFLTAGWCTCARIVSILVCEKVIQYASTYYNRQTINENHGYKSHNAKTLNSHFTKCTMPNCNIKPDNKLDSVIEPLIGFSRNQNVSINDTKMGIEIMEDSSGRFFSKTFQSFAV